MLSAGASTRGRTATAIVLGIVALISLPAPARSATNPASASRSGVPRPDIILIVTDDQRWDTLETMPVVSRHLVDRGTRFRNAFVTNPLCCPSRASILTGDYSHTTGVYRQIPPYGRFESFDDSSTIATWLHDAGYDTGYFGKYIDGGQEAYLDGYVPPGWTQWAAFVHADYYDYALSVDGEISRHGAEPHDYSTDVLVERALAFLDRADDPVFLVLAVAAPHDPAIPAPRHRGTPTPDWTPPPSFDEPDVADKPAWLRRLPRLGEAGRRAVDAFRRQQIRSLQGVDEAVGSLIERQRARGRLRETVFVYTSDNGLSWGEHRWTKKEVPYDESIRVPLVIRADGLVEPHAEDRIALNIDLAPTIADLAGVPAPDTDGRTLRPLLTDRETEWRSAFLVEHLMGANPVPTYCAVRTRTHLYVRYETGERELFDLRVDPYQLVNAVDSEPSVVERLDHRLTVMCDPPPPRLAGSEGTRATGDGPDRAAGGEDMLPIVMVAALALGAGAVWVFGRRPLKSDRGSGRS